MSEEMSRVSFDRILVVDDTTANLQLLTNLLTEHGYNVHPASDGELALRFVQSMCTASLPGTAAERGPKERSIRVPHFSFHYHRHHKEKRKEKQYENLLQATSFRNGVAVWIPFTQYLLLRGCNSYDPPNSSSCI